MSLARLHKEPLSNLPHYEERVDLAAAFRWTARLNMHEAVANHFSLAVNEDGTQFLMNPNQVHFSRIKASDLLLIDANDPETLTGPNAPDPTAWGLHGAIHRNVPHARCAMHVHSIHFAFQDGTAKYLQMDSNIMAYYAKHTVLERDNCPSTRTGSAIETVLQTQFCSGIEWKHQSSLHVICQDRVPSTAAAPAGVRARSGNVDVPEHGRGPNAAADIRSGQLDDFLTEVGAFNFRGRARGRDGRTPG